MLLTLLSVQLLQGNKCKTNSVSLVTVNIYRANNDFHNAALNSHPLGFLYIPGVTLRILKCGSLVIKHLFIDVFSLFLYKSNGIRVESSWR